MFKGHPRGLIIAFFANMGERFGFYTMMAILVLFLQARFNLSAEIASSYYSWFYFGIYALALVGGLIADATRKYKLVIGIGLIIMFAGYLLMAIPGSSLTLTLFALFTIAFGNGLFKGNLQAVVGQMYDDPQYSKVRDTAYMIFYMGINIGAFFAPFAATGIRNWFLKTQGFEHEASLPALCHSLLNGKLQEVDALNNFAQLASKVAHQTIASFDELKAFASSYLEAFSKGYNYAFAIAAGAMVLSLLVFVFFSRHLPDKAKKQAEKNNEKRIIFEWKKSQALLIPLLLIALTALLFNFLFKDLMFGLVMGLFIAFSSFMLLISTKDEKPRVLSLILVFVVVVFFWMSFHQNGLTLTFFARDFTVKEVDPFTNIFFNLKSMLSFIVAVAGLILLILRKSIKERIISLIMLVVGSYLTYYFVHNFPPTNPITPETFQSFNPLFIVALTFPVMGIFSWLRKRGAEPSTPRKIGIGMIIAAAGFVIVLLGSLQLVAPKETVEMAKNGIQWTRVSPYWLISTYLILTIAELFLSPMGLSFVSKVAPERFQGIMQGGWLLATATGNKLLFIGGYFWDRIALWQLWAIFVICCLLSAGFIFSIMKRLEKATS